MVSLQLSPLLWWPQGNKEYNSFTINSIEYTGIKPWERGWDRLPSLLVAVRFVIQNVTEVNEQDRRL